MSDVQRNTLYFGFVACLLVGTGFVYSWNTTLQIVNFGLISAIMALGVNLQWGFAGLFNVCLLYTSPSPRDQRGTRMPSSA